jgi:hypothetical protein
LYNGENAKLKYSLSHLALCVLDIHNLWSFVFL